MLHITYNYVLQTLCGAPHNVCNDNGIAENLPLNRILVTMTLSTARFLSAV